MHSIDSVKDQVDDTTYLRLGLLGAGALLLHLAFTVAQSAPLARAPFFVIVLVMAGAAGLGLILAAGLQTPPSVLQWFVLLACMAEVIVRFLLWTQTSPSPDLATIDPGLYSDMAARLWLNAQNPYQWDLSGVLGLFRTSLVGSTPTVQGATVSHFPYPALAFVLAAPLASLGLPGAVPVNLVLQLALLGVLFAAAPRAYRPLVLIPVVAGVDYTLSSLIGANDIVWATLLTCMVLAWRKPAARAILFGLAASVKQVPWIVLPFILVRIWREENATAPWRRVAFFCGLSEAVFLAVNAPFALWDPVGWFSGITEPISDKLVFLGQGGLASLTQFGYLYLPKSFYLLAAAAMLALVLYIYQRYLHQLYDAMWIMPGLVMWFSYRSLGSYWVYWVFPLLASVSIQRHMSLPARPSPSPLPTAFAAVATLGALILLGTHLSFGPAAIQTRLVYPLYLNDSGQVTGITLQVENAGSNPLAPRFSVQTPGTFHNPLGWSVDEGPESLDPGQTAVFRISTADTARAFLPQDGAQVVIGDGNGDYALRSVVSIAPDRSYLWPDAIPNSSYLYWSESQNSPAFWGPNMPNLSTAALVTNDGRLALQLTLDPSRNGQHRVTMDNWILFPERPFGIWVHPSSTPPQGAPVDYGLEFDDGLHRLSIHFAAAEASASESPDSYVITRAVPMDQWSLQQIDLPSAYNQAGWPLPSLTRTTYRTLQADLDPIHMRLLLASSGAEVVRSVFGSIVQTDLPDAQALMAQTIDNPAGYYVRLADYYIQGRNYARALDALNQALAIAPSDSSARADVDRVEQMIAAVGGE